MKPTSEEQERLLQVSLNDGHGTPSGNIDGAFKNLIDNLFIFMIGGAFIGSLIAQTPGLIVGLIISGILAVTVQRPNTSHNHK